jgi:hypothetical protein
MKNSRNWIGVAIIGCAVSLLSCQKESLSPKASIETDVLKEEASLTLPLSGYQTKIITPLELNNKDCYSKGTIEYSLNGKVLALVDFGDGANDEIAIITKEGKSNKLNLNSKNKDTNFKKVIINPLVKTEDCEHIVQGTIKYYSQAGEWLATVDYGNGECDEWAIKKWKDGSKTFSLNWNKKKK